jgi:drug/metabolite transporter (DMT)-like permease
VSAGILLALTSALVWGSGDYCGGRAARRHDPFQVLVLASIAGISMLTAVALARGEGWALDTALGWAAAAGLAGALGIASLYQGLAIGSAAAVAPTAAVVAAALPVLFTAATTGLPGSLQTIGFAVALAGIWLVARAAPVGPASRTGIRLGLLAGVGFGGFLILIAQVDAGSVFVPLSVARAMMLAVGLLVVARRRSRLLAPASNPLALVAGLLDAGGNVLYLLARQHVRLDIAAVLSSLYPVATVLLARVVSHEPVTPTQWVGAGVCLAAVGLIAA